MEAFQFVGVPKSQNCGRAAADITLDKTYGKSSSCQSQPGLTISAAALQTVLIRRIVPSEGVEATNARPLMTAEVQQWCASLAGQLVQCGSDAWPP